MTVILKALIRYDPEPSKYARKIKEVSREAYRAGMEFWHANILPGHFQPGAEEKYGYAPRTERHERKKRQRHHGGQPLVFSGFARSKILGPPRIRAYPTRATMELYAPSYFYNKPPAGKPDMAAEVFAIAESEKPRIYRVMQDRAEQKLKTLRGPMRTVIIG